MSFSGITDGTQTSERDTLLNKTSNSRHYGEVTQVHPSTNTSPENGESVSTGTATASTSRSRSSSTLRLASPPFYGSQTSVDSSLISDFTEQPPDDTTILQACVFIEDAIQYHSIHHKIDHRSLVLYRWYYSRLVQWFLYGNLFILHMLAFIESPSSLTATSDVRYREDKVVIPCPVTITIEMICLLVLLAELIAKSFFMGRNRFMKSPWSLGCAVILAISFVDLFGTVGTLCSLETHQVRRMLRPFFLLQNSSLMKKTVNCLRRTMPQVASVLFLLFAHLYFFALFGMLLFPTESTQSKPGHNSSIESLIPRKNSSSTDEETLYFSTLADAFMNLLVLLTTANNPDITMPAYSLNRLYAIFFIVFLVIGLFCLMNMLTAVIYNQFRGYFSNSLQTSLFRRRLGMRAAFEVLRLRRIEFKFRSNIGATGQTISAEHLFLVLNKATIKKKYKEAMLQELSRYEDTSLDYDQFQDILGILETDINRKTRPIIRDVGRSHFLQILQNCFAHDYFSYFSCVVAIANVICISVELATEYRHIRVSRNSYLGVFNIVFVTYYMLEQCAKIWALGWRRYCWDRGNLVDGVITCILVVIELAYLILYGIPYWGKVRVPNTRVPLWDFMRIINILMMIRLLRMLTSQIKAVDVVTSTLIDLVKNLRAFAGLLVVIYYSYALLGMEIFRGKIKYIAKNDTNNSLKYECGSYYQLEYWANNFDDFAASLVVLWDVMVVNNWHVFLHVYSKVTTPWSQLYFIVWWLLTVVISLNLFTALILENFIMRWDRQQRRRLRTQSTSSEVYRGDPLTVHDMFRENLQEPSEESVLVELRQHPHFPFH